MGVQDQTWFKGEIDEVRVWDRARSQEEIQQMMDTHLVGNEPDLAGYWNFNEDSGNTVTDLSGNGNHGTLINGPTRVSSTFPSTTSFLRVTAPDATAHEVIYGMTDTSINSNWRRTRYWRNPLRLC